MQHCIASACRTITFESTNAVMTKVSQLGRYRTLAEGLGALHNIVLLCSAKTA